MNKLKEILKSLDSQLRLLQKDKNKASLLRMTKVSILRTGNVFPLLLHFSHSMTATGREGGSHRTTPAGTGPGC